MDYIEDALHQIQCGKNSGFAKWTMVGFIKDSKDYPLTNLQLKKMAWNRVTKFEQMNSLVNKALSTLFMQTCQHCQAKQ